VRIRIGVHRQNLGAVYVVRSVGMPALKIGDLEYHYVKNMRLLWSAHL